MRNPPLLAVAGDLVGCEHEGLHACDARHLVAPDLEEGMTEQGGMIL